MDIFKKTILRLSIQKQLAGKTWSLQSCVCYLVYFILKIPSFLLNCEWDLFSIYFVTVILGILASHKVLYIYFVTGH